MEQSFKTADGKILMYNSVDGSVSVIEQIAPPPVKFIGPKPIMGKTKIPDDVMMMLQDLIMSTAKPMDFLVINGLTPPQQVQTGQAGQTVGDAFTKTEDVLGPLDYYILVPEEKEKQLHKSSVNITSWVTEYKNGHKPEYKGYRKHRIMKEQFEWLQAHKDCSVVAYYSPECPVFASLGCQTHAKSIQPCILQGDGKTAPKVSEFVSSSSITSQQDALGAEEREI